MLKQPAAFSLYSAIFWLLLFFVLPVYYAEYSAISNRLFIWGDELMQDIIITVVILLLVIGSIIGCIAAITHYKKQSTQLYLVKMVKNALWLVVALLSLALFKAYATVANPDGVAMPSYGFLMPIFSIIGLRNAKRNIVGSSKTTI